MDLGEKLPREILRDKAGLPHLFDLSEKEVGTSDVSMGVRRFAPLERGHWLDGVLAVAFLWAFDSKLRAVTQESGRSIRSAGQNVTHHQLGTAPA